MTIQSSEAVVVGTPELFYDAANGNRSAIPEADG